MSSEFHKKIVFFRLVLKGFIPKLDGDIIYYLLENKSKNCESSLQSLSYTEALSTSNDSLNELFKEPFAVQLIFDKESSKVFRQEK